MIASYIKKLQTFCPVFFQTPTCTWATDADPIGFVSSIEEKYSSIDPPSSFSIIAFISVALRGGTLSCSLESLLYKKKKKDRKTENSF